MTAKNYKRTIRVKATPNAAYTALTEGFEHWWTKPDKVLRNVGDTARFDFSEENGYWIFRATELRPDRIEMTCIEAHHLVEGYTGQIEEEWLGTTVIWKIEQDGHETCIHFEHDGLAPELHCFDICRAGWDLFFVDSLKAYLDTGHGTPFIRT
ncbi:SRPBCC family protein [Maritalea porphyrae]|uniref:SRPBCC family protein n=1 Tax=Maritalea porphyrae TaxID=880732 RepID=UPI0022AF66A5|nr:SRPBCC domain-containing protein [Maritalea porphyrae]MCZ4274133.1 SRPBCC domain-containing protein [Maritalea porphyrae]